MKKSNKLTALILVLIVCHNSMAQDPSFSQFFSSPLNINPALTGNINDKWRLISNFRNQWITPANPYTTGTISADSKIFQNAVSNYVDEMTRVGIGGMLMYDQALAGALKSNYASFNVTGNIRLAGFPGRDYSGNRIRHISKIKMDGNAPEHRIGVGLGIIYGHRRLDISHLDFEEQFTGNGFNTNLPSGETALAQMKPYFSTSAGLLYSMQSENTSADIGAAAFHFNKPKQTFLNDEKQNLATRYVAHANLESMISDQLILNANGIYQYQGSASYFSVGGALGYYIPAYERDIIINAGAWYWSDNAIIPYIGFGYGKFQLGFTYDIIISKLNEAARRANTFELSLILRGGTGKSSGVIPAPWK